MENEIFQIVFHIISLGFIYSFVVMGVYITSRVIRFEDLTTEGSFGFGGAISASLIVGGISPWGALFLSVIGGMSAGIVTGILHTKLNMNNLMSGLVVTTALFSICIKIATSNLLLPQEVSIFLFPKIRIFLLLALVFFAFLAIKKLLLSELGLLLKAVGGNPQMVTSLGKSISGYIILGLALANGLTAFGGALFVQWNGYFSITGNIGTLVVGFAGLVLSEMINSKFSLSLILGSIIYQSVFAVAIEFELQPMWNNLIKAALIVFLIQVRSRKPILTQR